MGFQGAREHGYSLLPGEHGNYKRKIGLGTLEVKGIF